MWGALKDGFKEFATDALKEGGSLVKDTTEETERLKRAATDNLQRIGSRIGGATAGIDDETEVEHDQKEAESNYDGSLVETESKVDAAMSSSSPKSSATPSAELILERPANSNQLASGPHEASLRASSPRQRQSSLNFPRASLLMTSTLIDPPSQSMPSTLLERDDTVHELQVLLERLSTPRSRPKLMWLPPFSEQSISPSNSQLPVQRRMNSAMNVMPQSATVTRSLFMSTAIPSPLLSGLLHWRQSLQLEMHSSPKCVRTTRFNIASSRISNGHSVR